MTNKKLEEMIYDYGETLKHIGKCETDGKTGLKEYNKLVDHKEKLVEQFNEHFNNNSKLAQTLNVF
jgi:DNA repair ATPase RecN